MINIRVAKIKDVSRICEIHKRCVLLVNSKFYSKKAIGEWLKQISNENIKHQFLNSSWFVLLLDNKVIGFAQIGFDNKTIFQINIDPDFQNKGYGKKLYEFVEGLFKKRKIRTVSLRSTKNAVNFYKSLGFLEIKKSRVKLINTSIEMIEMKKIL